MVIIPKKTRVPKKIKKKAKKSEKVIKEELKLSYFDDLIHSDLVSKEKLLELVDLANISRQSAETKESLCLKIMYESTYGLDEVLDLCFETSELKQICRMLDLDASNKKKANLIGMIVETLPARKTRKIQTIIEENLEEEFDKAKIFNLFMIYFDGRCLFSYNPEPLDVGDSHMITSALNAISHLIKQITKSEGKLENIDMGDKELIFEYGSVKLPNPSLPESGPHTLIGVLLVNRETALMKHFLGTFIEKFEKKYKEYLIPEWDGNTDVFLSAYELVDETLKGIFI